jgi:hypothetical protein
MRFMARNMSPRDLHAVSSHPAAASGAAAGAGLGADAMAARRGEAAVV